MSFQKSTKALKQEVLDICGELTDGTSDFEAATLRYLNNLYRGLLAGGNEFGVDVGEPWVWAQSKRPMPLSLEPNYQGSITLTNGSSVGILSAAPAVSLLGRYLRVTNRSDVYLIVKHDANTTDIQFDQIYLDVGGSLAFTAYKMDYQLHDDVLVVDLTNNKLDFRETSGGVLTVTIPRGSYSPSDLAAYLSTAMTATGTSTYSVTFSDLTRKFTAAQGSAFSLLFASGPNAQTSVSALLGFDIEDQTLSASYTSPYANSAILRLTRPIQTYRSGFTSGQITLVDDLTFQRDYSYTNTCGGMPERFCISQQTSSGLWTAKMNASPATDYIRCEVNYIPVARKLVDSDLSFPLVPQPHDQYLVYGAAHFLLLDKTDTKAETYKQLATAKLQAMVNDSRKNTQLAGSDYGRILPRSSYRSFFTGYR